VNNQADNVNSRLTFEQQHLGSTFLAMSEQQIITLTQAGTDSQIHCQILGRQNWLAEYDAKNLPEKLSEKKSSCKNHQILFACCFYLND